MTRVAFLIAALATCAVIAKGARAEATAPDAGRVAAALDELYRAEKSRGEVRLRIIKPERTSELGMDVWTLGQDHALVVIKSPARDRGISTLRVEENLWQHLPRISRTIRIPPSMMLASWMGSDFTNDDLVQASSYRGDFDGKVVGPSKEPNAWLIRFESKPGKVGLWKTIDVVMDAERMLPIKASYFDRRGKLARVMSFEDVRILDGKELPAKLVLTTTEHPERRTEVVYVSLSFNEPVSRRLFSVANLERKR